MSAFLVQDTTINRVIGFLIHDRDGDWTRDLIAKETGCQLPEDAGKLAAAMFALNVNAIEQRYGEGEAASFRPLDFVYRYELTTRIQAYKSLRCWLYQCTEGDVPETSLLYSTMQKVSAELAHSIVYAMPAYDAAEWD